MAQNSDAVLLQGGGALTLQAPSASTLPTQSGWIVREKNKIRTPTRLFLGEAFLYIFFAYSLYW